MRCVQSSRLLAHIMLRFLHTPTECFPTYSWTGHGRRRCTFSSGHAHGEQGFQRGGRGHLQQHAPRDHHERGQRHVGTDKPSEPSSAQRQPRSTRAPVHGEQPASGQCQQQANATGNKSREHFPASVEEPSATRPHPCSPYDPLLLPVWHAQSSNIQQHGK